MSWKIIDLSEFGYTEPVVLKCAVVDDANNIALELRMEARKNGGVVSPAIYNTIIIKNLIESAPFELSATAIIKEVPLKVLILIMERIIDTHGYFIRTSVGQRMGLEYDDYGIRVMTEEQASKKYP